MRLSPVPNHNLVAIPPYYRYSDAGRYAATPEEAQLAFVNRSLANLRLGRPEKPFSMRPRQMIRFRPWRSQSFVKSEHSMSSGILTAV